MVTKKGTDSVKLFAVFLGGRAPRCNTELHDVVFVVGESIEDTYLRLLEKWFGASEGLHIDSWMELSVIDGYRISLTREKSAGEKRLFFVNLGAYRPGEFSELHANTFLVAEGKREVMARAKERLLKGMHFVHTDDVYDLDDWLEISEVDGYHIALIPTAEAEVLEPNNGYRIIPKKLVAEFVKSRGEN